MLHKNQTQCHTRRVQLQVLQPLMQQFLENLPFHFKRYSQPVSLTCILSVFVPFWSENLLVQRKKFQPLERESAIAKKGALMLAGLGQNYIYSLYLITHQKSLSSLSSLLSHTAQEVHFCRQQFQIVYAPFCSAYFFNPFFFASYAKESFAEYSSVFWTFCEI